LMLLHISLICEELTALPFVYNSNNDLCTTAAFFHFYVGLSYVVSIALLVVSYRYHFFSDSFGLNAFIQKWTMCIITIFPLITLLPFINRSYANHDGPWCTASSDHGDHDWEVGVFYIWVWLLLACSATFLSLTMYQILKIDPAMGWKVFSTSGTYAAISIFAWIPRTIAQIANYRQARLTTNEWVYSYLPLYSAGILYTLVFLTEKKALMLFDRNFHLEAGCDDGRHGSTFSFEGSDVRFPSSQSFTGSGTGSGAGTRLTFDSDGNPIRRLNLAFSIDASSAGVPSRTSTNQSVGNPMGASLESDSTDLGL
jgi:hypothetical protein